MSYRPRNYQQRAIVDTQDEWRWKRKLLGVAATGAGKTAIGLWIVEKYVEKYFSRVLILVHTRDLVAQWEDRIYDHHKSLMPIGVIQAERHKARGKVIIATYQSLGQPGRLDDLFRRGQIDILIVDETHRVLSPTYMALIQRIESHNPNVKVLGLTATPNRTDGQPLSLVYDDVAFNVGITSLVNDGYLAPSRQIDIPVTVDLDEVTFRGGDFEAAGVAARLNRPHVNELFFKQWQALAGNRPTVIFTATVKHAADVAELFRRHGVAAAHISGMTTDSEQAQWDEGGIQSAFNKGKLQVVANAYKWVEGVDIPRCSCVGWLRPTTSTLVFQQAVGRGMRLFPGKDDNLILRVVPRSGRKLAGLEDIGFAANPLGLPMAGILHEREYEKNYRTKFETLFGPEVAWRSLGKRR